MLQITPGGFFKKVNGSLVIGELEPGAFPEAPLHIVGIGGYVNGGDDGVNARFAVERTDGVWAVLGAGSNSGFFVWENGANFNFIEADAEDDWDDVNFAGATVWMQIQSGGNVLIGSQATAEELLHLRKTAGVVGIHLEGVSDTRIVFDTDGTESWAIGLDDSENDSFVFANSGSLLTNPRFVIQRGGNIGAGGELNPETLTEWTHAQPYLTLHNSTQEDLDGGRESRLIFKGEQSGGEETELAMLEVSHDGAADDSLGKMVLKVNTGAGLAEGLRIDSNADVDIINDLTAGTIRADDGYTGSWVNDEGDTVTVVGGVIVSVAA